MKRAGGFVPGSESINRAECSPPVDKRIKRAEFFAPGGGRIKRAVRFAVYAVTFLLLCGADLLLERMTAGTWLAFLVRLGCFALSAAVFRAWRIRRAASAAAFLFLLLSLTAGFYWGLTFLFLRTFEAVTACADTAPVNEHGQIK